MLKNTSDIFSLKDRVAVVTGGAGLLGVQHAAALLEGGAKVVLGDLQLERLDAAVKKLDSPNVMALVIDVTQKSSIEAACAQIEAKWGAVDILINNAAIDAKVSGDQGLVEKSRFENFALDQWNTELNVGITGSFLCAQVFG